VEPANKYLNSGAIEEGIKMTKISESFKSKIIY